MAGWPAEFAAAAFATTASGRRYSNQYRLLFEVRDAWIRSLKEYLDMLHACLVFGAPPAVPGNGEISR